MERSIQNEEQLPDIARDILDYHPQHRVFAFYGEMGAGKTTLIKQLCRLLEVKDTTSSPTFSIINEYDTPSGVPVYHFDFYRIDHITELQQIGVDEYLYSGCYCFIEWPEKGAALLPPDTIKVNIEALPSGERIFNY